jgi:hypothetical protein
LYYLHDEIARRGRGDLATSEIRGGNKIRRGRNDSAFQFPSTRRLRWKFIDEIILLWGGLEPLSEIQHQELDSSGKSVLKTKRIWSSLL